MKLKALRVPLKLAAKVKLELLSKNLIKRGILPIKDKEFIYFPLVEDTDIKDFEIVSKEFKTQEKPKSLKEALKDVIPKDKLSFLKTAYDFIGEIAILEIDEQLQQYENLIAKNLLKVNKSIKSVYKKDSLFEGKFRLRKHKYLAGKKSTQTIHKENGIKIKVDINDMYFSPRLSNERLRLSKLVKNERVLVIGSGCGPYTCVLAKKGFAKEVIGIEFNEKAHEFAEFNIKLNKLKNAKNILGDANKKIKDLGVFDRIILATPDNSEEFLENSINHLTSKGVIHFATFCKEEDKDKVKQNISKLIVNFCKSFNISFVKTGHHAPFIFRFSIDIVINN